MRFALFAFVFVSACRTAPPPDASTHQGVAFIHKRTHGGGPLIVAMHGMGDTPENFAPVFEGYPGKAELVFPRGLEPHGGGWRWFGWPRGATDAELAAAIDAAEKKLWPAIAELADGRPVVVTGFSQGAVMSFLIAQRHPGAVTFALPIAGRLPSTLFPHDHAKSAPIYAVHGADDRVIDPSFAQATVAAFRDDGATAELKLFPGVAHHIPPQVQEDVWAHLRPYAP